MRIGIDARVLGAQTGGIETYVRNVIRSLAIVAPDDEYTLFLDPPLPRTAIDGAQNMRRVVLPPYNPRRPNPLAFPLAQMRQRIDVIHVQNQAPVLCPARIVVTVHDIAFEHFPQFFLPARVAGLRRMVPLTIRRAAAVLTVSEYSRQDIVRRYRIPPEKVVVAHGGPDPLVHLLHDAARLAAVRERHATGDHFILYVGNLEPRKNLKTLIDAYVRLRQSDTIRHKLVMVGNRAWLYDDIFEAARASSYADQLVFTDYISEEDVVSLYNAADLFVYPSIFEGLGLPPLEAMACGTPVVTSNTSSLPEVVDDAALMVDPLDVEALATAIATVLNDAGLRAQLREKGFRRVAAYSWDRAARTISEVYRSASHPRRR